MNRLPEQILTVVEDSNCLVDGLETESFETCAKWLTRLEPKGGHRQYRPVGEAIPALDHSHRASVTFAVLRSAGLLPYRSDGELQVLIAHPGGPYFARRDNGWWSIVKGMVEPGESDLEAALREFQEETGWPAPAQPWVELGETTLKSRKVVVAYGVEATLDPATMEPGQFRIGSRSYPEIDEVRWLGPEEAKVKLNPALGVFIDRLADHLTAAGNNVP